MGRVEDLATSWGWLCINSVFLKYVPVASFLLFQATSHDNQALCSNLVRVEACTLKLASESVSSLGGKSLLWPEVGVQQKC